MWAAVQALQTGVAVSRSPSGNCQLSVRVQALDVVAALAACFDADEAAEGAAPDAVRREMRRIRQHQGVGFER